MRYPFARERGTLVGALILFVAYTALVVAQMWTVDATTDEQSYAFAGRLILAEGWEDPSTRLQGPIGLLANQTLVHNRFDVGEELRLWSGPHDPALLLGRLGMLPFGWLCGCVVFAWATRAFGRRGGLLAVTLYALNPIIVGYSALQAVDIAHAATLMFALYLLWRFAERPKWTGVALAGAALGLSIATKYLALLAVPVFLAVVAWRTVITTHAGATVKLAKAALAIALLGISAYFALHASYGFSVDFASTDVADYQSETVRRAVSNPIARAAVAWAPAPLIQGVDFQSSVDDRATAAYLNGTFASRHTTFYLWTLGLKTPDWVVALLAIALVGGAAHAARGRATRRARSTALVLLTTASIYGIYLSVFATLQTGIRYVIPVLPMLFVPAASVVRWRSLRFRSEAVHAWAFAAVVALSVLELSSPWPHLISYYNRTAGGAARGYEYFRASNSDWGQYRNVDVVTLCPDGHTTREVLARGGPRFGCLAFNTRTLTAVDPEDRRRSRHWVRALERVGQPVAHFGAGWFVFHSTPDAWEAALLATPDDEAGGDDRVRAELAIAYLSTGNDTAFLRHRHALDEQRGRPLDELTARIRPAHSPDATCELVVDASRAWRSVGRHDLAVSTLRDHPNPEVREHSEFPLALGRALAFDGDLEGAAACLERTRSRRHGRTARLLAELYARMGQFEFAHAVLREAAEQSTGSEYERIVSHLDNSAAYAAYIENLRSTLSIDSVDVPLADAQPGKATGVRIDGSNR